jgi:hypothetical protein
VQDDRAAPDEGGVELSGLGRGIVDDQEVAPLEVVSEAGETGVDHAVGTGDEQPYLVAGLPTPLCGCRCGRIAGTGESDAGLLAEKRHEATSATRSATR